jgi:hypothetical protein
MDKRHFTVVIGSKEHGLYVSSKPSSAAKKAVSKLCASNKSKNVEFCLREITQGSKKKTYGPYLGEMKKLKTPIELKGRVIRHEIKVYLKKGKSLKTAKKMRGGGPNLSIAEQMAIFMNQAIERNNFQGILDAIFNGNLDSYNILTLAEKLPEFFKKMINYINSSASNENKNKYFFIICYIIAFRDEDHTIFNHLISVIRLDRFIEIVFQIDYGTEFNRIITNMGSNIERMNDRKINIMKSRLFMNLINFYSKKMSLDDFKELLIKLFSIQNNSFINFILDELFNFFTNSYIGYQTINPSFKLLEFLLENKEVFKNFIKILKPKFYGRSYNSFFINRIIREIIGTEETQTELFRNVESN